MSDDFLYTGPLPTQISGDVALGRTYAHEGRRMLGKLLNINGVNTRIANGEPGGFFKKSVQMPDGTVVTVTTNDGHHVLRIDTPRPTQEVAYRHEHQSSTGSAPHSVLTPETDGASPSPEVPLPHPPSPEEPPEEPEEPRHDGSDYMWVGCRYTSPDVSFLILGAIMIEPDTAPPDAENGMVRRGIVNGTAFWTSGDVLYLAPDGDGEYTLDTTNLLAASSIDAAIETQYRDNRNAGLGTGAVYAETNIIYGTHAVEVEVNFQASMADGVYRYTRDGRFVTSANGLRCESIHLWNIRDPVDLLGFDPTTDDQTGRTVRSLGNRHDDSPYYQGTVPYVLWDHVFTLDPHEDDQEEPYDTRPKARAARRGLEQHAGVQTRILPGEYILALQSIDPLPTFGSRRAGEVIPLYKDEAEDTGLPYRSFYSDYDEFMQPVGANHGLDAEVEVRLGKGDQATTFHFETSIAESCDENYAINPYGFGAYDPCIPFEGPNPAGPNFSPQFIAINPLAGYARWTGKGDLAPILGGGVYSHREDRRAPLDIFIHVVATSQPDQREWAEFAGAALFKVLEAATAGVYGHLLIHDPGGEEGCVALLSETTKSQLWKFNASEQTLEAVDVAGKEDDYVYGWVVDESDPNGGFMSPYLREMWWYYQWKYDSKNHCRASLAIGVTAVKGVFYFENGQVAYFNDPITSTDCC